MINNKNKLTVDDLIVEYMLTKVKKGLEPEVYYYEFINFLYNFETKMPVADTLYETPDLFTRFIERKNEYDWNNEPHMELIYNESANDYLLKANYKLSTFDRSVTNIYFLGFNDKDKIHKYIEEYLVDCPKRTIKEPLELTEEEQLIGKYVSANIINYIWQSHISHLIELNKWPMQCNDINKYLLDYDLAQYIEIPSIREELIELYKDLSLKISNLYHYDKDLEISTSSNKYLANSNFKLLREGNERFFDLAFGFGDYKRTLDINVSNLKFEESHELNQIKPWYKDKSSLQEEKPKEYAKKIINSIENVNK